ncbi:MAG: hypothetical protein ACI4X9_03845 [Kiritimatiellia bacterium]
MKKALVALALFAAGIAAADVTSSNIVGYNKSTTGADNNFCTVPFFSIGYNTSDIQQIQLDDGGLGSIGWGEELFSIWEGVPTVKSGSEFLFLDASMDPTGEATTYYWGDDTGNKASFSVDAGQGVVINCAADLTVQAQGDVPTSAVSFTTIADNNFTGNPFPQAIDVQNIKIDDEGAGAIGWGEELFAVWEGIPTVKSGSEFLFLDASMDPTGEATTYYWGDDAGNKVSYSIAAGQGVVVNCAEGLKLTIDPPYTL